MNRLGLVAEAWTPLRGGRSTPGETYLLLVEASHDGDERGMGKMDGPCGGEVYRVAKLGARHSSCDA
jgi:hypothetical protein